jgi:hypothetical protein
VNHLFPKTMIASQLDCKNDKSRWRAAPYLAENYSSFATKLPIRAGSGLEYHPSAHRLRLGIIVRKAQLRAIPKEQ